MLKKRIVVTLCHDGKGNCVKPVAFSTNRRRVGDLMSKIKILAKRNIDELCLLDIYASEERREQNLDLIEEVCSELTCPVSIGGNISNRRQVRELMNHGADKIILRTHANRSVIENIAHFIGSQSTVVAFDVVKPYVSLGKTNQNILKMSMINAHLAGVGEMLVTSVMHDGKMKGMDLHLADMLAGCPYVTVLNGGAERPEDMLEAFDRGIDAVGASSMFLFTDITPRDCAEFLHANGVPVRNDPPFEWKFKGVKS